MAWRRPCPPAVPSLPRGSLLVFPQWSCHSLHLPVGVLGPLETAGGELGLWSGSGSVGTCPSPCPFSCVPPKVLDVINKTTTERPKDVEKKDWPGGSQLRSNLMASSRVFLTGCGRSGQPRSTSGHTPTSPEGRLPFLTKGPRKGTLIR